MELTIDQALQQGIAAHEEGELQDAERLYRVVLQAQPNHPDANHNLGVLAVTVGKPLKAIPLFKLALEANPKIEQFWLSYIDALLRLERLDEAHKALVDGGLCDVSEQNPGIFLRQIQEKLGLVTLSRDQPPQDQIDTLLEHYQAGRFAETEELGALLTREFPAFQFGWKVLGAVLAQTGRPNDAIVAYEKSVDLSPTDAQAHSNLGVALKALGKLDGAEASYKRAITLDPDLPAYHYNLGNTLRDLSRLEEAKSCYRRAIALKPDYSEAFANLANILEESGKITEALANYREAIAHNPNCVEAHNNLGGALKELGKPAEAEACYKRAIAVNPNFWEGHFNLGAIHESLGQLDEAEASFRQAIALKQDSSLAHRHLLNCLFSQNKRTDFFEQLHYLISKGETNSVIGSMVCRSSLKYGMEVANPFCSDPLRYVVHTELISHCESKKALIAHTKSLVETDRLFAKSQRLLINGKQTSGNIFCLGDKYINDIAMMIRVEIEKYRLNFQGSSEGLFTHWPSDYMLKGWLVSMSSGGSLQPHIHEKGWVSGSLYINVPPKSTPDSGSLNVGIGEDSDGTDARLNRKETIDVETGSLVLFPSSLTHYTTPFHSEEDRVVLAFDVQRT